MTESQALFSAGEVGGIVGGACYGNLNAEVMAVVADSREVRSGSLFVALPGEKADGHDFIEKALLQGASCVIAGADRSAEILDRVAATRTSPATKNVLAEACLVFVDTPLRALQSLAKDYRKRMRHLFRIGVTGSSGKTTTKECIGAALAPVYPEGALVMNAGNLNSDIGLALSMFAIRPEHRVGVFEMGMNRIGEMDELDEIYEPDMAVITNIGTAHIGIIGSRQKIAEEKKKIFSRFDGGQVGIVWEEDSFKEFLEAGLHGRAVEFGLRSTRGLQGVENLGLSGWKLRWTGQTIRFPLPGRHNLNNALAALSVAAEMGADPSLAAKGLQHVKPLFGRSEIFEGTISLIRDCYNANPDSVAAALDFVDSVEWPKRKVCVLGSMLELGDSSEAEHRAIGRRVAESTMDGLFFFGDETKVAYEEAKRLARAADTDKNTDGGADKGTDNDKGETPENHASPRRAKLRSRKIFYSCNMEELRQAVLGYLSEGDLVLVKGSRGMELERLTSALFDAGLVDSVPAEKKGGNNAS